jgi:glycosyltransferase involved in cell wall biosynthesis
VNVKKILLLTSSLAPGGAEVVVTQLALTVRARGCEVSVVSMTEPTAFVEELQDGGVSVVSLGMKPGQANLAGLLRFLSYTRRFRPDIIHAHMYHANILARLTRVLIGAPVVCTIHSEFESSRRKDTAWIRERIYRCTDAACTVSVAVSERVRQRYVRESIVPENRISVIENGIDLNRFRPCDERRPTTRTALGWQGSFVWLAVGRLELAKDHLGLIQAFQNVHHQFPNSKLVIAGEGRLRPQIEQLIHRAGLQSAVSLLGLRTDVSDLMNACDAVVMSSAWEGAALVLLEAAAVGRSVVSTEVGSAPEVIVSGRTGLLVPPRQPGALSRAMTQLMTLGPDQLTQMGEEARRHVTRQFSLRSMHSRYMELYQAVLASSQ